MAEYDVIIVGTGAGGGTLAQHLAPSGKRILLLERGDWLPREPQNWLAQDVFVDNRYVSEDTWYDEKGKPFQPQIHYFVGGGTAMGGRGEAADTGGSDDAAAGSTTIRDPRSDLARPRHRRGGRGGRRGGRGFRWRSPAGAV